MTEGHSQPAWSEERVARELEAWFAERGLDVWPTYRTFVRDGRKRLHAEVVRTGGAACWALELGVDVVGVNPSARQESSCSLVTTAPTFAFRKAAMRSRALPPRRKRGTAAGDVFASRHVEERRSSGHRTIFPRRVPIAPYGVVIPLIPPPAGHKGMRAVFARHLPELGDETRGHDIDNIPCSTRTRSRLQRGRLGARGSPEERLSVPSPKRDSALH